MSDVATDHALPNDLAGRRRAAVAGIGAALAIGVMELFSIASNYPLAVIPFATSIVLVIGLAGGRRRRSRAR